MEVQWYLASVFDVNLFFSVIADSVLLVQQVFDVFEEHIP